MQRQRPGGSGVADLLPVLPCTRLRFIFDGSAEELIILLLFSLHRASQTQPAGATAAAPEVSLGGCCYLANGTIGPNQVFRKSRTPTLSSQRDRIPEDVNWLIGYRRRQLTDYPGSLIGANCRGLCTSPILRPAAPGTAPLTAFGCARNWGDGLAGGDSRCILSLSRVSSPRQVRTHCLGRAVCTLS